MPQPPNTSSQRDGRITADLAKLGVSTEDDGHRRMLAVLAYLEARRP